MKALVAATFVACVLAITALPATSAPAINLAWNDCIDGATAAFDKNFACDTNDGADVMVASFIAPAGMSRFLGVDVYFRVSQETCVATVPWWHVKGTGRCRNGALTLNGDFEASTGACDASAWSVPALGGLGAVTNDSPIVGTSRGNGAVGVPTSNSVALTPDVHYYAVKFVLSHFKTTGTGACFGCSMAWCFQLERVTLAQVAGAPGGNVDIRDAGTNSFVTYQSSELTACVGHGCTAARRPTWGSVKALYR